MPLLVAEMMTADEQVSFGPFHASVNVAQLLKEPIGATRRYGIAELADAAGEAMVAGDVELIRSLRGILVRANLVTRVDENCSRCLRPVTCPVAFRIEEEFFPTIDVVSGLPAAVPDEEGGFVIDHNHILDLGEAVRQYVTLAAPMKPLCKPDCSGICPTCGADLNQGSCACAPTAIDRRWAKLAALKTAGPRRAAPRKRPSIARQASRPRNPLPPRERK